MRYLLDTRRYTASRHSDTDTNYLHECYSYTNTPNTIYANSTIRKTRAIFFPDTSAADTCNSDTDTDNARHPCE
jgi:hypothetical protein